MQKDTICVEVIKHLQFANHRGNSHIGRENIVERAMKYLVREEHPDVPHALLTIYGASGTGKTSIMAGSKPNKSPWQPIICWGGEALVDCVPPHRPHPPPFGRTTV